MIYKFVVGMAIFHISIEKMIYKSLKICLELSTVAEGFQPPIR